MVIFFFVSQFIVFYFMSNISKLSLIKRYNRKGKSSCKMKIYSLEFCKGKLRFMQNK